MNLQQFLSQQPIDKLFQQFFSIEGQSQKSKSQQSVLINSIVLYIASNHTFTFKNLYEECQYQLEVNDQQRDAINKLCRLLCGVIGKAPYLLKNVQVKFFVGEVLQFLLSKVFVTVCSADCIRCIWALVNAFTAAYPLSGQDNIAKKGCCSVEKSFCGSSTEMKDQNNCCGGNSQKQSSGCCSAPSTQPQQSTSSLITKHEQVCKSIVSRFLNTFKLHVKAYPFKVRKDIYKLIYYVLKFTRFSQQHFLKSFSQHERYEMQNFEAIETQPLFVQIGITKQQLIQTTIKNLSDEKDPRNMQLIFQNYLILINLFAQQICIFNFRQQLFENIQVYYPLSMQGDQSGFQIDEQDRFSEFQLKGLLDQCLLQDIFCNQVRQLLVEKMSAPPINDYVSLYVKYITKFNPMLWKSKLVDMKLHAEKYIVLTVNLLQKLCEEEYLDENYTAQSSGGHCQDSGDSCCGGNKSKVHQVQFSISQLIATIIKNVFISSTQNNTYSIYSLQCEQRFIQFLNSLIVSKLFNTTENHKHAGTIIDIVKTVLNSEVVGKNVAEVKSTKVSKKPKQSGCCSGNDNNDSCCSTSPNEKTTKYQSPCQQPSFQSSSLKQSYGKRINFEQMLTNYVILKFMQYWSAKGDVAFKLGLLIISLNKKLESVSIQQFNSSTVDQSTQNLMQHLLITLGNVYEANLQTDQIKIMVLKTLMIVANIYNKLYERDSNKRQKSMTKVTKVNNGIIHKDCIKLSEFLNNPSNKNNQNSSSFDRSQQPILKSYVDYIMQMYVTAQKEQISQQTLKIVKNLFGSLIETKTGLDLNKQSQLDVKLYGLVRYLSIVGYQKLSQTQLSQKLSHTFISILLFSNKQVNNKLTALLKYYNYSTILSLIRQIFTQIKSFNNESQKIDQHTLQSLFINLSLNGKVLKDKFMEFHVVELEAGVSFVELISNDLNEIKHENGTENIAKILVWYMLKNIWRGTLSNPNEREKSYLTQLNTLIEKSHSIQEGSIVSLITNSASSRLAAFIKLYSNPLSVDSFTMPIPYSDLQCTLLFVKYLKSKNQQSTIRFNPCLGQLYDAGMVEYFWNRLFKSMTYEEKSLISLEKKTQLVALLEYLPEKILVNHAGQVAPLVIYTTKNHTEKMEDQKQTNQQTQKDQFDFSMSKLISKLCPTLPQQSLITYVVPYCLSYLKIAAISCQNGTQIPSNITPLSQTLNVLLSISKIVEILIQKVQQKSSQKGFKHEKLRKSVLQLHKKEFRQYYGRLIYHKKRLIRQSSRYLLSSFE